MELSENVIDSVANKYHVEASRLAKAVQIVLQNEISPKPYPNGNYAVKSHTKGAPTAYQVDPRYESCNCPDGSNIVSGDGTLLRYANLCKHYIAYLLMREQLFENAKQLAVDTGIPQLAVTYRTIRESVIDRREAQVKAEHAAQPRTEWYEELDG